MLLVGLPGDIVTLTYTGMGGTAISFDYGTGHRMGHGLRDLTLTGPGHSTGTIGVVFGGVNGAEGLDFRDFKIQSFGVNLEMASHTWLAYFQHGMVRDGAGSAGSSLQHLRTSANRREGSLSDSTSAECPAFQGGSQNPATSHD